LAESIDSPSHRLTAFLHGLRPADIPSEVAARARQCLLDALGCGLFGSEQPWSRILRAEMRADARDGKCTVIGEALMLPAPAAAMCNGTAIHGFELDDHLAAPIVHPAASIVPAVLATAEETGAPGERALLGLIVGYEVANRVGLALGDEPAHRGFHKTSLAGPVAAAAAASVTAGLDLAQMRSAIGLACSASAGIKNFAAGKGGGMVKRLHLGRAAEAGVRFARLANRGFEGPPNAIDGRMGLIETFGGEGRRPACLDAGLGRDWAVLDAWFKVYPICGWIQSVVQATLELRADRNFVPADIASVRVGVSAYAARNNGAPAPSDTMGAQYSIPWCTALALLGNPADPAEYAQSRVADPALRKVAGRVALHVDPHAESVYPGKYAASVEVELAGGKMLRTSVADCRGTPSDPCTDDELVAKFMLLAGKRLARPDAERVAGLVERLEAQADLSRLGESLRAVEAERPS